MLVGESQGHVREGSSLVGARSRISFFWVVIWSIVRGLVVNKRPPVQISVAKVVQAVLWQGREAL